MPAAELKVLIVDDSPEDRETFRRFLTRGAKTPYLILEAETAEQGFETCLREQPDCLLLDYLLPDFDGLEFLKRLAERTDIPLNTVVMLTGKGDETVAVEAMKNGATDYLTKGTLTSTSLRRAIEKAMETMLLRREIERCNRELEQFAHTAGHDLQEPLRTVSGFCYLLDTTYGGKLDAQARDWLNEIVAGTQRMQQFLDDLLAYASIGGGHVLTLTDCGAACEEAIQNLDAAIQENGAVVTQHGLPTLMANRPKLVQLFQNLIGNALKFHGDQPPRVEVTAVRPEQEWHFSVRDNGIGIASKNFERIFRMFQRLNSPDKYQGTGIGLAICQRIVELHGGRISVESQLGTGSVFHFTIPS